MTQIFHRGFLQKAGGDRRGDMSAGHPGHGWSRRVQVSVELCPVIVPGHCDVKTEPADVRLWRRTALILT